MHIVTERLYISVSQLIYLYIYTSVVCAFELVHLHQHVNMKNGTNNIWHYSFVYVHITSSKKTNAAYVGVTTVIPLKTFELLAFSFNWFTMNLI